MNKPFVAGLLAIALAFLVVACGGGGSSSAEASLASAIRNDPRLPLVRAKARQIVAKDLSAGSIYQAVFIRDLNTFVELAIETQGGPKVRIPAPAVPGVPAGRRAHRRRDRLRWKPHQGYGRNRPGEFSRPGRRQIRCGDRRHGIPVGAGARRCGHPAPGKRVDVPLHAALLTAVSAGVGRHARRLGRHSA